MPKARKKPLRIYAAGQESAEAVFWRTLGVTFLICVTLMLMLLALMLDRSPGPQAQAEPTGGDALFERAQAWRSWSGERFGAMAWSGAAAKAAFLFGPRKASEAACQQRLGRMGGEELATLWEAYKRGSTWLPRLCLLRAHLEGREPAELGGLGGKVWEQFEGDELLEKEQILAVNVFRGAPLNPGSMMWDRWLARCMLRARGELSQVCLESVGTKAMGSEQPISLLDFLHHKLRTLDAGAPDFEERLGEVTFFLENVARFGQAKVWRIQIEALLNTDYEMQIGAAWTLCRMMTVEREEVQDAAAMALYRTIARTPGQGELDRRKWRQACALAFGGQPPDLEVTQEPVIHEEQVAALWPSLSWEAFAAPEGKLGLGCVTTTPGVPWWGCAAADQWKGERTSVPDSLERAFVHTRYMDWFWEDGGQDWERFELLRQQALARGQ